MSIKFYLTIAISVSSEKDKLTGLILWQWEMQFKGYDCWVKRVMRNAIADHTCTLVRVLLYLRTSWRYDRTIRPVNEQFARSFLWKCSLHGVAWPPHPQKSGKGQGTSASTTCALISLQSNQIAEQPLNRTRDLTHATKSCDFNHALEFNKHSTCISIYYIPQPVYSIVRVCIGLA